MFLNRKFWCSAMKISTLIVNAAQIYMVKNEDENFVVIFYFSPLCFSCWCLYMYSQGEDTLPHFQNFLYFYRPTFCSTPCFTLSWVFSYQRSHYVTLHLLPITWHQLKERKISARILVLKTYFFTIFVTFTLKMERLTNVNSNYSQATSLSS